MPIQHPDDLPAFWSWPAPVRPLTDSNAMWFWQDCRCAICGVEAGNLVLDHDHRTALCRGYLCRSCNARESRAPTRPFTLYRICHPANVYGLEERFISARGDEAEPEPPPSLELLAAMRRGAEACGRVG